MRLDLLHSLSRRRLFDDPGIYVTRYWGSDGSPQNKYHYQEFAQCFFSLPAPPPAVPRIHVPPVTTNHLIMLRTSTIPGGESWNVWNVLWTVAHVLWTVAHVLWTVAHVLRHVYSRRESPTQ